MTMETTRRRLLSSAIAIGSALPFLSATRLSAAGAGLPASLEDGFLDPPQSARPRVWWHWMSGNVSVEGAKLDLDWMQRIGIGGVHAFSGGGLPAPQVIQPPASFMGPVWQDALRRSLDQTLAGGMEFGIAGSPGWHVTGGPWVAPADGMKKYVWSELEIEGSRPFRGKLPQPPATTGPFQAVKGGKSKESAYGDAAVIAFPTPRAERPLPEARWSSQLGEIDISAATKSDLTGAGVALARSEGAGETWLEVQFARTATLRAVTLSIKEGARVQIYSVGSRDDLRLTATAEVRPMAIGDEQPDWQHTLAFAPATARRFRIVLEPLEIEHETGLSKINPVREPSKFNLVQVALIAGARVNGFEAKAGFVSSMAPDIVDTPAVAAGSRVDSAKVIDLSSRMAADGTLDWTPPAGRWTVLRFGWSLTGTVNGPAEANAMGLEVDKFDPAAVRRYLHHYLSLYEQATGRKPGPAGVQTLLIDSWESRVQNWTPTLIEQFRQRRGYEPLRFLPALTGRVVDDSDTSERFLFDFRQTLKDMLADNHYGVIAGELKTRGMGYYAEAQGDSPRAIGDGMTIKARADIPTAEFWFRPFSTIAGQPPLKADLEEAASVGHVYGKPIIAAEALTVLALDDAWAFSPAMLKPVADEIFARGINRLLLHESHHQPLVGKRPGLQLFLWGQYFNRNDTWAEDAKPWITYLARTSHLLQQGTFVADVAYFYGEERNLTELFHHRINTDVPLGYKYDYINPEALLTLLSVRDGRIVTPSGMSYAVLYLPENVRRVSLPVARKLRELARAGAVLVGARPLGGLGLASQDREVLEILDELWRPAHTVARAGSARVYATLAEAFEQERISPDFRVEGTEQPPLLHLHRRTDDGHLYFVSNQGASPVKCWAALRVAGYVPEIWRADSGSVSPVSFEQRDGATRVHLDLDAHEAVFIVLRKRSERSEWREPEIARKQVATLTGPWSVAFAPGLGAPATATFDTLASWSLSSDPGIKYFSGSATYTTTLDLPADRAGPRQRFELDLGDVRELAEVSVNGKRLGTLWKAPYRLEVTKALKPGRNVIAIRVVNLWPNRLIGDRQPGAVPIAFAPDNRYKATSPLLPSGLLGPVRLMSLGSSA